MNKDNHGLSRSVGQCCAGQHCVDNSLELSRQHKYAICHQIVHMVCGEPGPNDSLTCFCCLNEKPQADKEPEDPPEHHPEATPQPVPVTADDTSLNGATVASTSSNNNKAAARTTATTGRKKPGKGRRIKVGCRVKTTRSKLYHVLTSPSQRECLPSTEANSHTYYGTVVGGNTSSGYVVRFDVLPAQENKIKMI